MKPALNSHKRLKTTTTKEKAQKKRKEKETEKNKNTAQRREKQQHKAGKTNAHTAGGPQQKNVEQSGRGEGR